MVFMKSSMVSTGHFMVFVKPYPSRFKVFMKTLFVWS